jgi:hypothetical protein
LVEWRPATEKQIIGNLSEVQEVLRSLGLPVKKDG